MGFLNNTTVTVDAILTKKGRELLAQGTNAFNITKFAVADDEVDYSLWDVTHPNGTDYYGTVIENMPLLEAFPDENHVMKYKLITLPKDTPSMPILNITLDTTAFNNSSHGNRVCEANTVGTMSDSGYTFTIHDRSVCTFVGGGTTAEDNSVTLQAVSSITILPIQQINNAITQITITGDDTGITASKTLTNNWTSGGAS